VLKNEVNPEDLNLKDGISSQLATPLSVTAVYAGSFDPFTLGHKDIAARAGKLYSKVIIAIGVNSSKTPMFSIEEKIALIKEELKDVKGNFEVVTFEGLLAHFAVTSKATVLVRGIRGITDTAQESQLASINREQSGYEDLETVFMPARKEYEDVSSSATKELLRNGGDIRNYVSHRIEMAMRNKLAGKNGDDLLNSTMDGILSPEVAEKIVYDRWIHLAKRLRVTDSVAREVGQKVIESYKQPQRKYHDLVHIAEGLLALDGFRDQIAALDAFELGWFFHDIVYDPSDTKKGSNELKSKQELIDISSTLNVATGVTNRAAQFIEATIEHKAYESDSDGAFFLDNDLWILGAPRNRYDKYVQDLREEYSVFDDEAFKSGRAKFLQSMLGREQIFKTQHFADRFSDNIKGNLEHELEQIVWGSVTAITGSIGSGKSTVINAISQQGYYVLNADSIAQELRQPGTDTYDRIVAHFGKDVLTEDLTIDRKALGKIVFSDSEQMKVLESILHPQIQKTAFDRFLQKVLDKDFKIAYEVPVLFESGLESRGFKKIVFVAADEQIRIARIIARDNPTEEMARLKIAAQLPDSDKISKSDVVIYNNGDVSSLMAQLKLEFGLE
jgi:dephospho-CoA kinase/pantetheine-phosphate adenylyltransferase